MDSSLASYDLSKLTGWHQATNHLVNQAMDLDYSHPEAAAAATNVSLEAIRDGLIDKLGQENLPEAIKAEATAAINAIVDANLTTDVDPSLMNDMALVMTDVAEQHFQDIWDMLMESVREQQMLEEMEECQNGGAEGAQGGTGPAGATGGASAGGAAESGGAAGGESTTGSVTESGGAAGGESTTGSVTENAGAAGSNATTGSATESAGAAGGSTTSAGTAGGADAGGGGEAGATAGGGATDVGAGAGGGANAGGGNWMVKLARALADVQSEYLDHLMGAYDRMAGASQAEKTFVGAGADTSTNAQGQTAEQVRTENTANQQNFIRAQAEMTAYSRLFSMSSETTSNVLKSIGEGLTSIARKQ